MMNLPGRSQLVRLARLICFMITGPALACTVAVLVDGGRVLFCNNEDWSDPQTRIWFVPSATHYGCAYVGFGNGWGQGGFNTQGLAFDGVAGFQEEWEHDGVQPKAPRHSVERMLESCANVEDAIAFYTRYFEPAFAGAKLVVADRSGASAVIGAKNGRLEVVRRASSFVFGYGGKRVAPLLAESAEASATRAAELLRTAQQTGRYGTKFSNIFDLWTGDIHVHQFASERPVARLNLAVELKKGGHYYDLPAIAQQMSEPLRPLTAMVPGGEPEGEPILVDP